MPNSTNLTLFRSVNGLIRKSEHLAFQFVSKEKLYERLSSFKKKSIEKIGGKVSPAWVILSFLGIGAAIGFGIYQAFTAQNAIVSLIDPNGDGTIAPWILKIIGASLSVIGMALGHGIFESIEHNEYTGERTFSKWFWVCITGAIVYMGYQFFLVKSAGAGLHNVALSYMPYVVLGIAVLELLVGAFILEKAFNYMALLAVSILLGFALRDMSRKSRGTNNSYRDYLTMLIIHNTQNTSSPIEKEGNDNIRRAIAYYSGIQLSQQTIESLRPEVNVQEPVQKTTPIVETAPAVVNTGANVSTSTTESKQAEENMEAFVSDAVDDDLTA